MDRKGRCGTTSSHMCLMSSGQVHWGMALAAGLVVVSPVDFIPFFPLDDMLAGGTGMIAAALAVVQKIRQRREDQELALWTRVHAGAPYPVPTKALLMTSSKEGTPDA